MLSVMKMLLKGEVGGCALNSHGNYIVDHGKSWKNHGIVFMNFCGNPEMGKYGQKSLENFHLSVVFCFFCLYCLKKSEIEVHQTLLIRCRVRARVQFFKSYCPL